MIAFSSVELVASSAASSISSSSFKLVARGESEQPSNIFISQHVFSANGPLTIQNKGSGIISLKNGADLEAQGDIFILAQGASTAALDEATARDGISLPGAGSVLVNAEWAGFKIQGTNVIDAGEGSTISLNSGFETDKIQLDGATIRNKHQLISALDSLDVVANLGTIISASDLGLLINSDLQVINGSPQGLLSIRQEDLSSTSIRGIVVPQEVELRLATAPTLNVTGETNVSGTLSFVGTANAVSSLLSVIVQEGGTIQTQGDLSISTHAIRNDGIITALDDGATLQISGGSPISIGGNGTYKLSNHGTLIFSVPGSDTITVTDNTGLDLGTGGRAMFLGGSGSTVLFRPNSSTVVTGQGIVQITSTAVVSSGASMTLSSESHLSISAENIRAGAITGGASVALAAQNNLCLDGPISIPSGTLQLVGHKMTNQALQSISASSIFLQSSSATPISIATAGTIAPSMLQRMNTSSVYIGGWDMNADITVVGDVDLSDTAIGNIYVVTTGNFESANSQVILGTDTNFNVYGSNIHTGSVTGGASSTFNATNSLTVSGSISSASVAAVSDYIRGSQGASITAATVLLKPYHDIPITVGSDISSNLNAYLLSSTTASYAYIGGWDRSGNVTITNDIDLSNSHIANLYTITTGDYSAANTHLTLDSGKNFNVYASHINTGSITGGASAAFNAENTLTIGGNVSGGYVSVLGDHITGSQNSSIAGTTVIFKPYHDISVTVGSDNADNVSSSLIASTTANYLYVGGWDRSHSITVSDDLNLSNGTINNMYVITTGNYSATGKGMLLSSATNYNVYAHDVATGHVTSGASISFNATGNLVVDGDITIPGGYTALTGHTLSVNSNAAIHTSTGVFRNSTDSHLLIGEAGSTIDKQLIAHTSAQYLYLGGWDRSQGVTVTGEMDLSNANIANLYVINTGNYDGSGSHVTANGTTNFNVYGANIQTGSITGGASANFTATGDLNITGLISTGYVALTGNKITRTDNASIVAGTAVIKPYSDIVINVGASPENTLQSAVLSGLTANYSYVGGWERNSGISLTSNLDVSANNIQNLYFITTGNFSGAGQTISLHNGTNVSIFGHDLVAGNIEGGGSAALNASNSLILSGSITIPNGYVALSGSSLSSSNSTISAGTVVIKPNTDALISIGSGAGFVISADLLNNTNANYLYAGGWDRSAGIRVNGTVNLSSTGIQNFYAITTGNYNANGAQLVLPSATNLSVYATNIDTGAVTNGASASFIATNACLLSDDLNLAGGYIGITSNSLDTTANAQISASTVVLKPYSDIAINIGQGSGYVLTADLLNSISALYLYIGGWDRSAGINVTGNTDLSEKSAGNVYMITQGNYLATGSTSSYNVNNNLNVYAQKIWTGNSSGLNAAAYHSVEDLHVDGTVNAETVIFDGHPVVYEPIGYTSGIHAKSLLPFHTTTYCDIWGSADCVAVYDKNQQLKLRHGHLLLRAERNTFVTVSNATMELKKGTIGLVSATRHSWAVQILSGAPRGACNVVINSRKFGLGVGEDIRFSSENSAMSCPIARRNLRCIVQSNANLEWSEFAFGSLVSQNELVKSILRSPGAKEKNVSSKMLKSAAAIGTVLNGHGAYK